jgi:hypothetical protein
MLACISCDTCYIQSKALTPKFRTLTYGRLLEAQLSSLWVGLKFLLISEGQTMDMRRTVPLMDASLTLPKGQTIYAKYSIEWDSTTEK